MKNWKDNVHFVLIEPAEQGNIGASARAIKNMGFSKLLMVNPPELSKEAFWTAHGAEDVLGGAEVYNDLSDALQNMCLVTGTSRRKGRKRGLFLNPWDAVKRMYNIAQDNKIAILFGRESRGLYNEEVESCGFMIAIPSAHEQPSLNLAQAVLLIAYELSRVALTEVISCPETTPVNPKESAIRLIPRHETDRLLMRIQSALRLIDYFPETETEEARQMMLNISRFIGRAGLVHWEAKMLHGLCSHLERKFGVVI